MIAGTVALLQKQWTAGALHLAGGHDRDPVGEHVRLFHIMCCEQNCPLSFLPLQQFPDFMTRTGIDAARRFVEHDQL